MRAVSTLIIAIPLFASTMASGRANTVADCQSLTKNCKCVVPILERDLGTKQVELLFRAWAMSYSENQTVRDRFSRQHARELDSIVLRYGAMKDFVGFQCGTMDFDSDYAGLG
jgi:hypothetical protein